jgi:hypothetical protein
MERQLSAASAPRPDGRDPHLTDVAAGMTSLFPRCYAHHSPEAVEPAVSLSIVSRSRPTARIGAVDYFDGSPGSRVGALELKEAGASPLGT